MIEESKPWYQSIAVWGGVISIIAPLLGWAAHITLSVEETNKLAVDLVGIATGIGGLMAIFGRVRAGKEPSKITLK